MRAPIGEFTLVDSFGDKHKYRVIPHDPYAAMRIVSILSGHMAALGYSLGVGMAATGSIQSQDMGALVRELLQQDVIEMLFARTSRQSSAGGDYVGLGDEAAFNAAYTQNMREMQHAIVHIIEYNNFLPVPVISTLRNLMGDKMAGLTAVLQRMTQPADPSGTSPATA